MKAIIVQCEKCGTKNRIHAHSDGLRPVCARCRTHLPHHDTSFRTRTKKQSKRPQHDTAFCARAEKQSKRPHVGLCALLFALLADTAYGIYVTPSLLKKDHSNLSLEESQKTDDARMQYEQQFAARAARLNYEVSAISTSALRKSAIEGYERELAGRKSFDKRFALSLRERAQLHMQAFASDSTKSFHDAIRSIAQEAAPKGANISVRESPHGIALHIDFDMSSMTSGEHGIQTKHHTKDTLKKEVSSLISRVTNDIFQFCKDLNLASIHVGCRHLVRTQYPNGSARDENTMLYKIRIQKNRIEELTNNPFLDVYSTTRYFEEEEDNFETIKIIIKKL